MAQKGDFEISWDPEQYLRFADERLQPAIDLLRRVDSTNPSVICDLGCGAGNVTRLLAARWPAARIVGVDSSAEMLSKARAVLPSVDWREADMATFEPDVAPDLIFSNAALHWMGDHPRLFGRLFALLAPGGELAVQMPRNFMAASHTGIAEAAADGPWRDVLAPHLHRAAVEAPELYWDLLRAAGAQATLWQTEYVHALHGTDPVVQWTMGTALRPLLAVLEEPWRSEFLADYARRMAVAYPPRPDGTTLFPFRRLFILARKAA